MHTPSVLHSCQTALITHCTSKPISAGNGGKRKARPNAALAKVAERHGLQQSVVSLPASVTFDSKALEDWLDKLGVERPSQFETGSYRSFNSFVASTSTARRIFDQTERIDEVSSIDANISTARCSSDEASTSGRDQVASQELGKRSTFGKPRRRPLVIYSSRASRTSSASVQGEIRDNTLRKPARGKRLVKSGAITEELLAQQTGVSPDAAFLSDLQTRLRQGVPKATTGVPRSAVRMFLHQSSRQLLSSEEERRLAQIIQYGESMQHTTTTRRSGSSPSTGVNQTLPTSDGQHAELQLNREVAKRLLFEFNRLLVVSVASKFSTTSSIDIEDLIAEGMKAIWKAVETFKPERGRFSTYAYLVMKSQLSRFVASHSGVVRLPAHWYSIAGKIRRVQQQLNSQPGRTKLATPKEIGQVMGMPAARVQQYLKAGKSDISLESPARTGSNHKSEASSQLLVDTIAENGSPEADIMSEAVNSLITEDVEALLSSLNSVEKNVVKLRYGLSTKDGKGHSLRKVGETLKLSIETVRQIEHRAMKKLRKPYRMNLLRLHLYSTAEQ